MRTYWQFRNYLDQLGLEYDYDCEFNNYLILKDRVVIAEIPAYQARNDFDNAVKELNTALDLDRLFANPLLQ